MPAASLAEFVAIVAYTAVLGTALVRYAVLHLRGATLERCAGPVHQRLFAAGVVLALVCAAFSFAGHYWWQPRLVGPLWLFTAASNAASIWLSRRTVRAAGIDYTARPIASPPLAPASKGDPAP